MTFDRPEGELTRLISAGVLRDHGMGSSLMVDVDELQRFFRKPLRREPASEPRAEVSDTEIDWLTERDAAIHLRLSLRSLRSIPSSVIRFGGPIRKRTYRRSDLDAYLDAPDSQDPAASTSTFLVVNFDPDATDGDVLNEGPTP